MQTTTTTPPDQPDAEPGNVIEKQVETVTTRRVPDTLVGAESGSPAVTSGYFEALPERLSAIAFVVLTAIEGLLGIRFLLAAFGANTASGFVSFINNVSWPFMRPFANVFSDRSWDQGVIEVSTLVAMGFYLLSFALIGMLITALAPRLNAHQGGAA